MNGRRLLGILLVALGIGVVGAKFLKAAALRAEAMRQDACRSLAPDPMPASLRGQEAPDFTLKDMSGKTWTLSSLRGRPVVINFWATWCAPCVEEMPEMESLVKRLGDKAVVLAVSVDEAWEPVRKFFAHGTSLPVVLDAEKNVSMRYSTEKYPETFIIDAAGKVRHFFVNKRAWGTAEAALCVESVR